MADDEQRKLIKRSYPFLVYEILKDETSEFGDRYNATDIADSIESKKGIQPDRKTIYESVDLLKSLGVDIQMDDKPGSQGYYLCSRPLSYGQMLLIADGIESIDNIQAGEDL